MKFEGRWFFCELCDCLAISCPHCRNTSCNGSGCEKCHEEFEEVNNMSDDEMPKKEDVPFHPDAAKALFGDMRDSEAVK